MRVQGGAAWAFKAGRPGIAGAVEEGNPRWFRRGSRRAERSRCARLKESLEGGVGLSAGEAGERARGLRQRGERGELAGLGRSGCGVGAGRGAREWARGEPVGPGERRERGRSGPVLG